MRGSGLRSVPDEHADPDALVGRVARGDTTAFETLYDELSAAVFGLARRVVRDQARAEDITQEAFVELWHKAYLFDPQAGTARTWVLTVTHRRAVDAVRRNEAQRRQDGHAAPEREATVDEPAEVVVAAEEKSRVHTCLETLTELQRESVRLAYFDGHTYPEVATLLERPLPTIKSRMRDGLLRLRDCLEGVR